VRATLTAPAIRDELDAATARLREAGVETAESDAEWLLAGPLGLGRLELALRAEQELGPEAVEAYRAAVARRARREPLQRILGWEQFRGLRVDLTGAVLVPRPETEILGELARALLPPTRPGYRPLAIDVGTGSGCLACALAAERPDVDVLAIDLCPAAAVTARDNAGRLGLAGRVRVIASDLLEAVAAAGADLIVSNPPYLPTAVLPTLAPEVRDHDPRLALDGGTDGLGVIAPLVASAPARLRPEGAIALETAGGAQAAAVAALLRAAGFVGMETHRDLAGVDRFVTARLGGVAPLWDA
jgi:release factor glutamine methyltransferase